MGHEGLYCHLEKYCHLPDPLTDPQACQVLIDGLKGTYISRPSDDEETSDSDGEDVEDGTVLSDDESDYD